MRIAFIHAVKSGNNKNLILNTDEKTFKYFTGAWICPPAIYVKSAKDIIKIIENAINDGYALKIG